MRGRTKKIWTQQPPKPQICISKSVLYFRLFYHQSFQIWVNVMCILLWWAFIFTCCASFSIVLIYVLKIISSIYTLFSCNSNSVKLNLGLYINILFQYFPSFFITSLSFSNTHQNILLLWLRLCVRCVPKGPAGSGKSTYCSVSNWFCLALIGPKRWLSIRCSFRHRCRRSLTVCHVFYPRPSKLIVQH